jgi:retron-type reverse transcriptase
VHGFLKGHSIKTFAAPHVGQRVVLRMDLQDFFPSFAGPRIQAFFRTAGYPESVADLLGGLCTNAAGLSAWKEVEKPVDPALLREARSLYARPHLPQGAPTSPALANLCAYRIDCRLSAMAQSAGACYTRYADDLAFSGDEAFDRSAERFSTYAAAILLEEGFTVHHRKTRIMRQSTRQYLAGMVANHHLNVIRADYDRLKAVLTNCVRYGPESQNRDAHPAFQSHLEGRVGFVQMINPMKGIRLRRILDQIQW